MIPLRLTLEGIYSYKEKQEIDFARLTEAGLFGIFGAVGSGKSSILEAIIIALYGDPERLSPKGERGSLINLQSQRLFIEFEFSVGQGHHSRYLTRYELKRSKKDFNSVGSPDHAFYRFEDGHWSALDVEDASGILGMKADDFKRTIIIPQGKFKEFVELKDKERTIMLSDLFHLDRFDLTGSVKTLLDKNHDEVLRLETQIGAIGNVSEEHRQQLEKDIELKQLEIHKHSEKINGLEKEFGALQILKGVHIDLQEVNERLEKLEQGRPMIEDRRARVERFRTAVEFFQREIERLDEIEKRLSENSRKMSELEHGVDERVKRLAELKSTRDKWFDEVSKKDEKQRRVDLLQKLIDMKQDQRKWESTRANLEKEKASIAETEESQKIAQDALLLKLDELARIEMNLPDSNALIHWASTLTAWKNLNHRQGQEESALNTLARSQADIQAEVEKIDGTWLETECPDYDIVRKRLEESLVSIEGRRDQEKLRLGLSAFAEHVIPGEPCPLCGATDHPAVVHVSGQGVLVQIQQEEKLLRETIARFTQEELKRSALMKEIAHGMEQMQKLSNQIQETREEIARITGEVTGGAWNEVGALERQLEAWKTLAAQRESLNQQIITSRKESEKVEKELSQMKDQLREKESGLAVLDAHIKRLQSEIESETDRWWEKYLEVEVNQIAADQEKVKLYLAGLNSKYEEAQHAFDRFQNEVIVIDTTISQLKHESMTLSDDLKEVQDAFQRKLISSAFHNREEISALLSSGIDSQREATEIEEFDRDLAVLNEKRKELLLKMNEQTFDAGRFDELGVALQDARSQSDEMKEGLGELNGQLKQLLENVKQKAALQGNLEKATIRRSGLRELDSLFKGKGFVSYISNFYLRDLCAAANVRFTKLTRNQLSLEVDGDNVFYVKDYLNGGEVRLLKTLSGGQTFQASLCLALALAERVKVLNKSEKSFFFLDEGFGSLDKDALAGVLDTLKTLRRENRIVGIISHVEELQQEMDLSLRVEFDKEKGSQVFIQ